MDNQPTATIMIIDDSITNLTMASKALGGTYRVQTLPSGEQALALLSRSPSLPDLILLDVDMPGLTGFEVIKRLKKDAKTAAIPVIFLTGMDGDTPELLGLSLGAVDYIRKPFSAPLLLTRIALHLKILQQQHSLADYSANLERKVEHKTRDIVNLQNAIVATITDLIEKRDGFTGGHVNRTSALMEKLLRAYLNAHPDCGLKEGEITLLAFYSRLHDVGKIGVPDRILLKEHRLDADEVEIIRLHTAYGAQALEKSRQSVRGDSYLDLAIDMARCHHERWDGAGYPSGLKGLDIPLPARLLAVCDVYDALVSERSYKKAIPQAEALHILREGAGTQFDPEAVRVFCQMVEATA